VTQSTHKQLASFSQASQIHVRDNHIKGQERRVEHRRFNEMFLLHASTSPFYPLFASLDVGAQMMKGRSGEVLWDDTIRLGIEMRKKLRLMAREFAEQEATLGAGSSSPSCRRRPGASTAETCLGGRADRPAGHRSGIGNSRPAPTGTASAASPKPAGR
jgi:arginine/lysine/ornithine decarboxylase